MKKKTNQVVEKAPDALLALWEKGFFKNGTTQKEVQEYLAQEGFNFHRDTLRMALIRAPYLINRKRDGVAEYAQTKPAISKVIDKIEDELFDEKLIEKLGKPFERELADLRHNFGKSGNCTAFLLRKILEKLIYITFTKQGKESKLDDPGAPGRIIGLEAMINTAAREKVEGIPFLTSHTANEVRGIKFLGDASAHNPLTEVDMKTIIPQMPYIIMAYKELARLL